MRLVLEVQDVEGVLEASLLYQQEVVEGARASGLMTAWVKLMCNMAQLLIEA
jgi:hypothetical protein